MASSCLVVFDLDDTLYLERDFVRSGFRAASLWFEITTGVAGLENRCLELFLTGERARVFDHALADLGVRVDGQLVAQLVEAYRTHTPDIALAEDAERYLLKPACRAQALITDGLASTQMAKIHALGLDQRLACVICTDAWGRDFWKPHSKGFEAVESWSGLRAGNLVYVADNPAKDFVTPRQRGWWTVQIARPERVHRTSSPDTSYEPHTIITNLDLLDDTLAALDPEWRPEES